VLASIREVIELLYAGIGDDDAIKDACRLFGNGFGATMIAVHHYDYSRSSGSVLVPIAGFDERLSAAYNEYYASTNIWMLRGRHMIRPRSVTVSHLLCPDEVLTKSEWCNDFLTPQGVFHSIGCVVQTGHDRTKTVTFLRGHHLGNFTIAEQRRLQALGPHLENVLRLHEKVVAAQTFGQIGLQLLDRMPTGVFLVDRNGIVIAVNRTAEILLEARDGLELAQGRLVAMVPASGGTLRRAIQAATGRPGSVVLPAGGSALVLRPSMLRPYAVWMAPLGASSSSFCDQRAVAAIFITDPDTDNAPSLEALIDLYRLTPREAQLGLLLAAGHDLKAAAREMKVSINTARTHLEHVFAKTCIYRQADLVRLLVGMPHLPHAAT
jgi:DNA-binding CsgD family transcriptional regulator